MPATEPSTTLQAKVRNEQGKGPARRLRAQGLVPAVVYRRQEKPLPISIDPRALRSAVAGEHRFNTLLTLQIEGAEKPETRQVLLKDHQFDPVQHLKLLHADFLEVRTDEKTRVEIPVLLTGRAVGVTDGGILQQNRRFLQVLVLPDKIPLKIEVDVTHLKIGQSIHVADLKMPEGAELKYQTNFTIAVVSAPEKEEVVVPVVAAVAEGAAGAAPAAGGAAPAAGAAAAPAGKEGDKAAAKAPAKAEGGDKAKK
jgi:large subunit ribosomal protein L25